MKKSITAVLMISALAVSMLGACGNKTSDEETQTEAAANIVVETVESGISFPYEIDDGNLVVTSLFSSDIDNPDCNNEYEDSIASLEIQNQSETCLINGDFQVTEPNGDVMNFHVDYLPAGEMIWAFSTENATIDDSDCEAIDAQCDYAGDSVMMEDSISVSVNDTEITLENISDSDLSNLTVYVHCLMDDTIFGGSVYIYTVDSLAAGESTVIDADDCYLGIAEVAAIVTE